jgi:hypothetical protein
VHENAKAARRRSCFAAISGKEITMLQQPQLAKFVRIL